MARGDAKPGGEAQAGGPPPGPDLSRVSARQNLNETAFFFPHLLATEAGEVKLEFTMPEALTEYEIAAMLDGEAVGDENTPVRTGQTLIFVRWAGEKGRR